MIKNRYTGSIFTFLLIPVFLFNSCDKFEGDQTSPSYIRIDSIGFGSEYDTEGTGKQDILDVWVYVNDQTIGAFEMPVEIPVLQQGSCRVEIWPGIKLNGISATRAPYPFFEPIVHEEIELVPDHLVSLGGTSAYRENTDFLWMEDFEDHILVLIPAPQSDTGIYRTAPGHPGAFIDENSAYSGVVTLTGENDYMLLQTDDGEGGGFLLKGGDYAFMEMHFRSDETVIIGMFIRQASGEIETRPFIGLNPTREWKKIYVNFTPVIADNPGATDFKVYLESRKTDEAPQVAIMFDNLKFLSRQNL